MNTSKIIAKNMAVTLLYQIVSIIFGFLLPRMLLVTYGASLHGLTSTITNIMNYVLLLNAGLTTAGTQVLYKPLRENDFKRLNEIYNAIKRFYFKTGIAFTIAVFGIAFVLPIIIGKEVESSTVFFLMITMGMQHILDCFLVSSLGTLLQADQKTYIVYYVNIITFVLRGVLQIILISNKVSIVVVQVIPPALVIIKFVFISKYVIKKYPMLDSKIKPDKNALSKRWAAFVHQIAGLVLNNTDVIILTIFTSQIMVSIYSVYQLVFSYLYSLVITVFSTGSIASFGQLLAQDDINAVQNKFSKFELVYYLVISIIYSICAVMILPFVSLYSSGVSYNYVDSKLAVLFILCGIFNSIRVPALTIIDAAGHYKETQNRAVIEMCINLFVSLILVHYLGIYGVLIGTIISFLYRTTDMVIYCNTKILMQKPIKSFLRILHVFMIILFSVLISKYFINIDILNWGNWVIVAIISTIISVAITIFLNFVVERTNMLELSYMVKNIIK